jgi:hypothetical protein
MADVDIALMWIAMSVASVKGLSALARAATTREVEAELAAITINGPHDEARSVKSSRLTGTRL